MNLTDLLLILLIALIIGLFVYLFLQRRQGNSSDAMQLLQNQMNQLTSMQNEKLDRTMSEIDDRLREQNQALNMQLQLSSTSQQKQFQASQENWKEFSKNLQNISVEVTKVSETGKNIQGFAEQLQSLENILRNPKQRGVLGEYFLESVLKNVLPPDAYKIQHKFKDGEIVDALIITREKNIPVDAKFSLENYNKVLNATSESDKQKFDKLFRQDLKNRIDETSKYIRPEEGTLDFAFMFIPADGLYYDLLTQKVGTISVASQNLIEYAFKKKVMIVSPTTLFAYLQTVLQGLRALKIEQSAEQIQKNVAVLQKHLVSYEEYFTRLGSNLERTVSSYNSASDELRKVDKDLIVITEDDTIAIPTMQIDKPDKHETAN